MRAQPSRDGELHKEAEMDTERIISETSVKKHFTKMSKECRDGSAKN